MDGKVVVPTTELRELRAIAALVREIRHIDADLSYEPNLDPTDDGDASYHWNYIRPQYEERDRLMRQLFPRPAVNNGEEG